MSGFSPDWLALREPADHQARNARLAENLRRRLADAREVRVLDLGCGTGSNLRALMPLLPDGQAWTLVDWDEALLAAARDRLAGWADSASQDGDTLRLSRGGRTASVRFRRADLTRDLEDCLAPAPTFVTAAALFDLVSEDWIAGFARALAARNLPLYTVLTYDGSETWSPPFALDRAVLAAFHLHQESDKGFGPAAGPRAGGALATAFAEVGYAVEAAPSPWRLGEDHRALIGELAAGIATAAAETGRVSGADADLWRKARAKASAVVGHVDILAWPPG